jgi:hypothetical protein
MKDMNKAKAVYDTVCAALDRMKWVYDKEEEELAITTGAKGTDLPIDIVIRVLPEAEVLSVQVPFAFEVPDEHSIDVAIAVTAANYGLIRGCFDYDMTTGDLRFRICAPYNGNTTLAEDVVEMLVLIAATTVDSYQTRLLMVAKGVVTPSQFLAEENPEEPDEEAEATDNEEEETEESAAVEEPREEEGGETVAPTDENTEADESLKAE